MWNVTWGVGMGIEEYKVWCEESKVWTLWSRASAVKCRA